MFRLTQPYPEMTVTLHFFWFGEGEAFKLFSLISSTHTKNIFSWKRFDFFILDEYTSSFFCSDLFKFPAHLYVDVLEGGGCAGVLVQSLHVAVGPV